MPEQWYLKTDDATYGPKTREELVAWAKIGRILPGQDVSCDGSQWFPVQEVPFLNIRWSIDIGDGNPPRGPFHKDAAEMLLRSGRIPQESKLVEARGPFTEEETEEFERLAAERPAAGDGGSAIEEEVPLPEPARPETKTETLPEECAATEEENEPRAGSIENELIDKLEALHAQLAERDALIAELREKLRGAGDERRRAGESAAAKLKEAIAAAAAEKDAAVAAETARGAARLEKSEAEKNALNEEWQRRFNALSAEKDAIAVERDNEERDYARKLSDAEKRAGERERAVREELRAALDETSARATAAEARAAAAESELAEALDSSNARESELRREITELKERIDRLPPDADSAASVSSAVYKLMRAEADELAAMLENEKREAENARQAWTQRADRLLARRQELLRRIGAGVEDMTRIAMRERPDDPQIARLRQERDTLRALQQRGAQESEARIRDLSEKSRRLEVEVQRLRQQSSESGAAVRQAAALREKLQMRERELLDERQKAAESNRREAAERQALLARIEMLEKQSSDPTLQRPGSGDGTAPKLSLPSWMGFKS